MMDAMVDLGQGSEPEYGAGFDLDKAVEDARKEEEAAGDSHLHISEDVVQEIARRALARVSSVVPASVGTTVLGIGRRSPEGIKITLLEEGAQPQISIDVYVLVKYGLRIPDVAWDLQEFLKNQLENSTGYEVKAVNIFVQGVYFGDQSSKNESSPEESEAKAVSAPAGE